MLMSKRTPTAIGEVLSAKVSNMGVLCMGFVVAIHVAGRELSGFIPGSLMWWCKWIVGFVGSVGVAFLLRRVCPKMSLILFGGRRVLYPL